MLTKSESVKTTLSQREYERLYPYKDLIKTIIINASTSNLPIGYKIAAEEIAKVHGYNMSCHCSSGWFKVTSKISGWMNEFETAKLREEALKKTEKDEKNNDKRSSRSNKRKS